MASRDLGLIRLSNLTEETTSPERQRKAIEASSVAIGSTVVGWAEDLDVSASKLHPFDRPQLGPWLTEPEKLSQYDCLRFWRLDRLVRKTTDFWDLIKWAREHNKNLASATEPIDLASDWGEIIAMIVAKVAEIEVKNTSLRVKDMVKHLDSEGRWFGPRVPYGHVAVPNPNGKGLVLERDDEAAEHLAKAAKRHIAGESTESIVRDFERLGVPTPLDVERIRKGKEPAGYRWQNTTLRKILGSQLMLGYVIRNGKVVRGPDGLPIRRGPALISEELFGRLQERLKESSKTRKRSAKTTQLLNIAFCATCEHPLYGRTVTRETDGQTKIYAYYVCLSRRFGTGCNEKHVHQEWLDDTTEDKLLYEIGDVEVMERRYNPGEDHSEDLARIRNAIKGVRTEYDKGWYDYPGGREEYEERVESLTSALREMASLPQIEPGWEYVSTRETYREAWGRMNKEERRQLLLDSGIKVMARQFEANISVPENIRERIQSRQK